MRRKATALLLIADGYTPPAVAQGLLGKPLDEDTVYRWLNVYEGTRDINQLQVKSGRGRHSAFFPQATPAAYLALRNLVAQMPGCANADFALRTRWTLCMLLSVLQEQWRWHVTSLAGVWGLLKRAHLSHKRARTHIHSPDPTYKDKHERIGNLQAIIGAQVTACQQFGNVITVPTMPTVSPEAPEAPEAPVPELPMAALDVLLYLDEMSYNRQPELASVYAPQGRVQPCADLCTQGEGTWRILAALNGHTGALSYCQRAHITLATLRIFYAQLTQDYAQAERIYVVVDNWPVHYHPDVLVNLIEQPYADAFRLPRTWPTAPSRAQPQTRLPIILVPLPTYASWLNPIEKLWRKLRQELLYAHRQVNDWTALRHDVDAYLAQFANGSQALLRYTGLLPT